MQPKSLLHTKKGTGLISVESEIQLYTKSKIITNTIPAAEKYNPFLKIEVPGKNIQNEERTKNNNAKPKNIFKT
jgi:hypothetical protein